MHSYRNKLIIVAGPTAIGKTAYAIQLAKSLDTEIVSCDSRQFYKEMRIGVARPSDNELATVRHHFIACRSVSNQYNIFDFHHDATNVINKLILEHGSAVAVGGSGLYIQALTSGVSRMPDPSPELRSTLQQMPIAEKQARLRELDPDYYSYVDINNPLRLQRALEVCITTGSPYSQILANQRPVPPPFECEMQVLHAEPSELRNRINERVDKMVTDGLVDEVHSLLSLRNLPTLRTVGYTELFSYFDGAITFDDAINQIKLNTWHYARKQLTWFRKYSNI